MKNVPPFPSDYFAIATGALSTVSAEFCKLPVIRKYDDRVNLGDVVDGVAISKSRRVPFLLDQSRFLKSQIGQCFRCLFSEIVIDHNGAKFVSCPPVIQDYLESSSFVWDERTGIAFQLATARHENGGLMGDISAAWGFACA